MRRRNSRRISSFRRFTSWAASACVAVTISTPPRSARGSDAPANAGPRSSDHAPRAWTKCIAGSIPTLPPLFFRMSRRAVSTPLSVMLGPPRAESFQDIDRPRQLSGDPHGPAGHKQRRLTGQVHPIARTKQPATPALGDAVDLHLSALNALLRLSTGLGGAGPFQKSVELDGVGPLRHTPALAPARRRSPAGPPGGSRRG